MTKEECVKGILILKRALPNLKIDEEVSFFILEELAVSEFMSAIKDIIRDKEVKLYDNILGEIWDRAINKNRLSCEEAWERVVDGMRRFGYIEYPEFEDKKIDRVIIMNGGWRSLCKSSDINWDKKRFISSYEELQDVEQAKIRQGELPYQENERIENKEFKNLIEKSNEKAI